MAGVSYHLYRSSASECLSSYVGLLTTNARSLSRMNWVWCCCSQSGRGGYAASGVTSTSPADLSVCVPDRHRPQRHRQRDIRHLHPARHTRRTASIHGYVGAHLRAVAGRTWPATWAPPRPPPTYLSRRPRHWALASLQLPSAGATLDCQPAQ